MSGVGKNVITIGRVKFDVFIHLLIDLEINILLNKMAILRYGAGKRMGE